MDSSSNANLKARFTSQRRQPGLGISLGMRDKQVRRVICAIGKYIHAVPPACTVRYRDRCPALAHLNILHPISEQKANPANELSVSAVFTRTSGVSVRTREPEIWHTTGIPGLPKSPVRLSFSTD